MDPGLPGDCPGCGGTILADWGETLCPRCLLKEGLLEGPPSPAHDDLEMIALGMRFPGYIIERELGSGSSSTVYLVREEATGAALAMKLYRPEFATSAAGTLRREAAALRRINHPGIVALKDFGDIEGQPYLLLEYVEGGSLRQHLRTKGRLAPEVAIRLAMQLCEALSAAHGEGLIHRDLKPENILLDRDGNPKLSDFGLVLDTTPLAATSLPSGLHGTPNYIAPELFHPGSVADERSDLFSLGVILYEMLTGEMPLGHFDAPSAKAGGGRLLDNTVLHALASNPARRVASAYELRQSLERVEKRLRLLRVTGRPVAAMAILSLLVAAVMFSRSPRGADAAIAQPPASARSVAPDRRIFERHIRDMETLRIDLVVEDQPLSAALALLTERAGVRFRLMPGIGNERVGASFTKKSVAEICERLLADAGMFTSMNGQGVLYVYRQVPVEGMSHADRERKARLAGLPEPTPVPEERRTVSIDRKGASIRELLEEISRQTLYKFDVPAGLCDESVPHFRIDGMPAAISFQMLLAREGYGWLPDRDGRFHVIKP